MHFSKSILLIFIFLSSANLWAQKDYKITDECIKEINLKPFASLLSIQKSEIDINKVINGSFTPFKDPDNKLNYNYYWLKLKIVNLSNFSNDFRLKLFDNWCEEAIVYSRPEKHQDWLIQKAGHLTPLSDLDINPFILVELKKVPNAISLHFEAFEKKEIYIRYTRVFRSSIQINPSLSSFYTASKQLLKESEANLWVIGFMCMPIILGFFHLFFYILVKDSAYLYYAIYGLSVPFALTIMDEFGNLTYHFFIMKILNYSLGYSCVLAFYLHLLISFSLGGFYQPRLGFLK